MELNIKGEREAKKMSQEDLAALSGVSRATISNLENNPDAITTTETLRKLATALGVKVGDFLCE